MMTITTEHSHWWKGDEEMIIKDLFEKDIDRSIQGVVTIGNEDEEQKWQELEEYVCTNEIVKSFRTFFRKYRESLTTPTEKIGVWVTGFFGSGKSHFLKILGYILENKEVAGIHASDYFKEKISDSSVFADIQQSAKASNLVVLFNIDSKAKSDSKTKTQAIMDIMVRAFNEAIGYCGSSPWVADLERTLDEEGKLPEFIEAFENISGRNWLQTRAKALLNRDSLIKALVAVRDMSEESAKIFIEDQTRNYTNTTEDFGKLINEYCDKHNSRVVFLIDEVGQFIDGNTQLMLNLQTCVEDLGKFAHGKAWIVITSQQELKAMINSTKDKQQDFSKIQGRFDTRLLLSGANADEVIKRRILGKKKNAETPLLALYDANCNRLSNLILFPAKPTWSGYKDAEDFKDVYPFVSYQFELLQKVFESIREHGMSEGKHISQNERSLLGAFQTSAKQVMNMESDLLIPFDSFFATAEEFIDSDVKTVFINAARKPSLEEFDIRVLRILFMIKHVKDMPATIDRLATLMVDSITANKGALKSCILEALQRLEAETLIQKNGEEYDFLTNEEQDVNKQISNSAYNEGEVQRTIFEIVFEKILESNKYRYDGRYDFALNRMVDSESKYSFNQDGLTIRVCTQFSGTKTPADFLSESILNDAIIVDLTNGSFIDELIRANKIATFRRNNSATMSASLTEIMSKKASEQSDRILRAEDLIRSALLTAPIYFGGAQLDIKKKDSKDRLQDALKEMVHRNYFKIGFVSYYYPDQKSIFNLLNENNIGLGDDLSGDSNKAAYDEIIEKVHDDKKMGRKTTVKSLLEHFSKRPYGWRDLDVRGMIVRLWKHQSLVISIHDHLVDEKNTLFKNDLVRKNNIDAMVVNPKEIIDENILYQVKRIMKDVYSENLPLDELQLKNGVINFFEIKQQFLSDLKTKYGSNYAGDKVAVELYQDFAAILKSKDPLSIFNEIISRADQLENRAETLEQLECFYKEGGHQQKNYQDALAVINWYNSNRIVLDLSCLDSVIEEMQSIVSMEMPFLKMTDLASLVFKARELKDQVLDDKYSYTVKLLEQNQNLIMKELQGALDGTFSDKQLSTIKTKADEIANLYQNWSSSLSKESPNIDSYITASNNSVSEFRKFISYVLNDDTINHLVKSKHISIIECVPVASKKVTSEADVEKVLDAIRTRLLVELKNNDEVDLI